MFADISGSSKLYKLTGDVQAKLVIDKMITQMKAITENHQGRVIKTIGDEIMVCFPHPDQACSAAISIQEQCHHPSGLTIKIGISYGDILIDNKDVFGNAVNDGACITKIARGNQILITEPLFNAVSHAIQIDCELFDQIRLKGSHVKSPIFRLHWHSSVNTHAATMMMSVDETLKQTPDDQLHLVQTGQSPFAILITPENTPYKIGRDRNRVDLCINNHLASREHCHIEYRRGKFVLVDHSTNGTYISVTNQPEIYLRREELPLIGEGYIGIGAPCKNPVCPLFHYHI